MWSKSFGSFGSFGSFAFVAALALASPVHAQSVLADRIQAGDRRAALEMIAKGADVNKTQADGTTPLHWATYKVDRELVLALIQKGGRADVVRYLLQHGASVDVKDDAGRTPSAVARSKEIAVLLQPARGFSR